MLTLDAAEIGAQLGSLLWPLIRLSAFFMAVPVFGAQLVTPRVRIMLALLVALILMPVLPPMPQVDFVSGAAFVLVAQNILIGVGLAFVLQILMHIFVMAAQIMAMKMGLGFASMNDPANGVAVTVLSQFYLLMATLLFLAFNGHLVAIDVLVESFYVLPVGGPGLGSNALWTLAGWAGWMFAAAMLIAPFAGPAMNAALGAAELLETGIKVIDLIMPIAKGGNIFAIGFPMMLVLGLAIVWVSMAGVLPHFERLSEEALTTMRELLR